MASPPDDSVPSRSREAEAREEPSLARRLFTEASPPVPSRDAERFTGPPPPVVDVPNKEEEITGPPPSVLPVSARIARISMQPDSLTGPPPPVFPVSEEIARISGDAKPKKPAPPRLEPLTGPPPPPPEPDESVPEL